MPSPPERRDLAGLAVLLLVLVTAVPAAVLVLPNTASYVVPLATRDLGLSGDAAAGFVRAAGFALPALLLTTPLAAALARRRPAPVVLFAGLALLLGAQASAAYVTSVPLVGLVRALQGAGAGAVLPATLLLAWERRERRLTAGVWAAALVAALVLATPAALVVTPAPGDARAAAWRAILHPFWWLGAAALVGCGLLALLRLRAVPGPGVPAPTRGERVLLLLPVAPSAGFAFLAVVTGYDWSPGAQLILAACAITGLLGLGLAGSRGSVTGSPLGYAVVMIAVGLLTMPVTGPLAGLLGGRGVPFGPFAAGAGCAALAVLTATVSARAAGRGALICGYALIVAALLAFLAFLGTGIGADRWELSGALGALGTGVGLALGTALRPAEAGPGLFGLTLCVPAVLGGHLVVGPLQVAKVGAVVRAGGGTGEALRALTDAYRLWLVGACCIAVVLAAATLWAGRGRRRRGTGLTAAPDASEAPLRAG
jgi:MFS family permease